MPAMAREVSPEFVRAEADLHATGSGEYPVSGATCGNSGMPHCIKCGK